MIGLQIPPAVLEKETLQCSSKEGCSPSFNYLQWCLQCPFLTTVIGFKVWPVHHQNASFNISFPACALPQGNKSPAASNLPCHRALFCSAISWLITNIIKWLLQWLEGQEVWGREPQKGATEGSQNYPWMCSPHPEKNEFAFKAGQALAWPQ